MKIITSWDEYFHQVSLRLDKNYWFLINGQLLKVAGFFYSDILKAFKGDAVYLCESRGCKSAGGQSLMSKNVVQFFFPAFSQSQFIRVRYWSRERIRASSFGLLCGQSGSGRFAEKSSLALVTRLRPQIWWFANDLQAPMETTLCCT